MSEAVHDDVRFTSTSVESTGDTLAHSLIEKGHLHGSGEHDSAVTFRRLPRGSPPRGVESAAGPAGTGATEPVHLHGRGEHRSSSRNSGSDSGSPPRAWRARRAALESAAAVRFTSTGVESTSK